LWIAAEGWPKLYNLWVFVAGTVLMRSAGCVINDFAARKIDPHVARTRDRPLASGMVSVAEALILFALLCGLALALLLTVARVPVAIALVAVALTIIYPFSKRFMPLPQMVLGAAFACAIPMAFYVELGRVPNKAWVLYLATMLWAMVYDTQYAMVDRDDDQRIGVKSSAIFFAGRARALIAVFQLLVIVLLVIVGRKAALPWPYYVGVGWGAGLFIYQQWLIRGREPAQCFRAFLNNQWFGAAVFAGLSFSLLPTA
jgi:4-hydroxybenzoate polyprenyltransferase